MDKGLLVTMRLSRKQQWITRQEHGIDSAGYAESLRLGAQHERAEVADELVPIQNKTHSPRIRN